MWMISGGAHDDAEAFRIYQTSQELMSKGGFHLRKWHSNSQYLRDIIATQKDAKSSSDGNQASQPSIQSNADTNMTETIMEGTTSRPTPVRWDSTICQGSCGQYGKRKNN